MAELNANKLPSLPHVLVEMLRVCQNPGSSFQQMAEIISRDAAIASRIILLANSSFYGRRGNVNTLERALLVLGTDTIKTMVITASVQQFFEEFNAGQQRHLKQFWRQSLSCALLAKALATLTSYASPDEAYLLGLLHNIGELVLTLNHSEVYPELLHSAEDFVDLVDRENETFLTNHCDIGAWLISDWGLGDFSADALRYHHAPLDSVVDAHHLVKLIYLAARLSEDPEVEIAVSYETAERLFDLTGALTKEIALQINKEVAEIATTLAIDINNHEDSTLAHQALGKQLKQRLLAQETASHLDKSADNLPSDQDTFAETAALLFGFRETKFLKLDSDTGTLRYRESNSDPLHSAADLSIPLEAERSIIASAGLNRRLISSHDQQLFSHSLPVIDQHFIRLTHSNAMLCAPVVHEDKLLGVLVMGDPHASPLNKDQTAFIMEFANLVGNLVARKATLSSNAESDEIRTLKAQVNVLAHEANNPLTIIRNYLESLASSSGRDSDEHSTYEILREEIDRASQILMRIQDLEMHETGEAISQNINTEIHQLVKLFEGAFFSAHSVVFNLDLDETLDQVSLPRNPLRQIVTNIIKNAAEAMPAGGEIHISTATTVNTNGKLLAEITIADNGPGLPPEIKQQLFKPGHTTKGGRHSGLGLSITHNLVTELGGNIMCRSSHKGTQFQILLPLK
ncbi:MAG: HDOD domain-containing protein [Hahellaceae bacterium]|nr:HDOD domain-containing protein [Hahellaceae bacterium]